MKSILQERLSVLDEKYRSKCTSITNKRLRVFYGWAKVNKIRKKEAISVVFENDCQREERTMRFINKMIDVVYVRDQTEEEKMGAEGAPRMFTEYSVFLSDKSIRGSLERAIKYNSEYDSKNVSEREREIIAAKLRESYLDTHPDYKEPIVQLQLKF